MITSNFPVGLLSLLDAKSMGKAPSEVADSYAPTLECLDLFMLNRQVFIGASAVNAVLTTTVRFAELTVPNGELWRVWRYDVQSNNLGAGQQIRLVGQIANTAANAVACTQGRGATGAAVNEQVLVCTEEPFWLTSGQALGFLAEQLIGGPITVSGHALVTRLKV